MLFKRDALREIVCGGTFEWVDVEPYEHVRLVARDFVSVRSGGEVNYRCVFQYEGRYYQMDYTSSNVDNSLEYEPEEIECKEVFPIICQVTVYVDSPQQ